MCNNDNDLIKLWKVAKLDNKMHNECLIAIYERINKNNKEDITIVHRNTGSFHFP